MSDSEEDEYTSDESEAEEPSSTLIPRSEKGKEKEDISRQKREIQKRKSKHA